VVLDRDGTVQWDGMSPTHFRQATHTYRKE
jgi:hypothetical protein